MKRRLFTVAVLLLSVAVAAAIDDPPAAAVATLVRDALRQKKPVTNYDNPIVPTAEVAVGIDKAVTPAYTAEKASGRSPFVQCNPVGTGLSTAIYHRMSSAVFPSR